MAGAITGRRGAGRGIPCRCGSRCRWCRRRRCFGGAEGVELLKEEADRGGEIFHRGGGGDRVGAFAAMGWPVLWSGWPLLLSEPWLAGPAPQRSRCPLWSGAGAPPGRFGPRRGSVGPGSCGGGRERQRNLFWGRPVSDRPCRRRGRGHRAKGEAPRSANPASPGPFSWPISRSYRRADPCRRGRCNRWL